jgi:hypothetical protein
MWLSRTKGGLSVSLSIPPLTTDFEKNRNVLQKNMKAKNAEQPIVAYG